MRTPVYTLCLVALGWLLPAPATAATPCEAPRISYQDKCLTPAQIEALKSQPCPTGKVRSKRTKGHCCWKGQSWLKKMRRCVGRPTQCPEDWEIRWEKCAPRLVDFVRFKGGSFQMGGTSGSGHWESPVHQVTLSDFLLAKTETTVGQYRRCVAAGECTAPKSAPGCTAAGATRDHPVNCVSWSQARDFCGWVGARLPTEAEWEFASRSQGHPEHPTCEWAVMDDPELRKPDGNQTAGCGKGGAWKVCSKKRPAHMRTDVCDLAGNLWEWTHDWFARYPSEPQHNPRGPWEAPTLAPGAKRVIRGGGWKSGPDSVRITRRQFDDPASQVVDVGFRCARTP